MKVKIISAFVLVLLASVVVGAYLGLASVNKSKELIQSASSSALMKQISRSSEKQSDYHLNLLSNIFDKAELSLMSLQQAAQRYFEKPELYNFKKNWDIEERLVHQANNQLVSKDDDTSTLLSFVQQEVNDKVLESISISAMLDNDFKNIQEADENIAAMYFNGISGYYRYYPGINLVDVMSPDNDIYAFDIYNNLRADKNPNRKTLWTPMYDDEAGNGNMITALAPVYANDEYIGSVGVDITIGKILKNFVLRNSKNISFIVDNKLRPAIVSDLQSSNLVVSLTKAEIDKGVKSDKVMPKNNVTHKQALNPELLKGLKALDDLEGFQSITVDKTIVHLTITRIEKLDWYYITVLAQEDVLSMPNKLNKELSNIINDLIMDSVTLYIVLLLLVVAVISWIVSRILEPVAQLTNITKLIANGDYDQEIKIHASSEIKTLVDNFKLMQQSIVKQHGKLQDSVESTSLALLEQKYLFSEIYKNSSDGLSVMIDGEFNDCNDALLKMFKIESRDALKNMAPGKLAPECQPDGEDSIQMYLDALNKCNRTGFSHHERLVHDINGDEFWIDAMLIKVNDNQRNIIYSIARLIVE